MKQLFVLIANLLNKILPDKVVDWLTRNHLLDKAYHLIMCLLISIVSYFVALIIGWNGEFIGLFTPVVIAMFIVLLFIMAKELWDKYANEGTISVWDILFGLLGGWGFALLMQWFYYNF